MRLPLKRVQLIVLILLCLFTYFHMSANADILFEEGFNSYETEPWGYSGAFWRVSGSDDMSISSTVARDGASSARVYLNYDTSSTHYRTELALNKEGLVNLTIGNTYWFAFSIYLGSEYTATVDHEIIWQFHGVPDDGEDYRNPVIAFKINRDEKYAVRIIGDADVITELGVYDRGVEHILGDVESKKWTDWVMMIKWDYTTGNVGRVYIWKNGELIVEDEGANCFNDVKGPYLKFGVYQYPWKNNEPTGVRIRTWYIDRILIGNGDSSYSEMATHNISSIPSNPQNAAIIIVSMPSNPQNATRK